MSRKKRRNRKNQKADLNIDPALADVIKRFAACGRCSYFWAGYQVIAGEKVVLTAVHEDDRQWLNLPWSHAVRELLLKSYALRFDVAYFHHEGSCPECQRRFVYDEVESDEVVLNETESTESESTEPNSAVPEVLETELTETEGEPEATVGESAEDSSDETRVDVLVMFKVARMPSTIINS